MIHNTYYITGINGFLGRHIVQELKKKDPSAYIVGLILPTDKDDDFSKFDVNPILVKGNILNREDLVRFFSVEGKGEKYLIHAAGKISVYKKNDPLTTKTNVEGTRNVVEVAKEFNVSEMIYVSSVDALDRKEGNDPIYEQDRYDENKVIGVYSKSKAISSNFVLEQASDNFKVIIVNPSAIIGPDDPLLAPINQAVKKAMNGKIPAVVKGGNNIVDVRDVASGIVHLLDKGKNKESYLLVGHYIEAKELINLAATYNHAKQVKLILPHWLVKCFTPFIELFAKIRGKSPLFTSFSLDCLIQNSNYSYEKANKLFGYQPRDIKESIKDTVDYYRS